MRSLGMTNMLIHKRCFVICLRQKTTKRAWRMLLYQLHPVLEWLLILHLGSVQLPAIESEQVNLKAGIRNQSRGRKVCLRGSVLDYNQNQQLLSFWSCLCLFPYSHNPLSSHP